MTYAAMMQSLFGDGWWRMTFKEQQQALDYRYAECHSIVHAKEE